MSGLVRVNVGCGRVWHPDWVNLDHRPASPEIRRFDLRQPLPFADAAVDAVYASHVLEHLDRSEGKKLLAECRRILKPGGIVRIVVPDLEELCRFYLRQLSLAVERPGSETELAYDWAYLQLIDQHVRRRPGGEILVHLEQPGLLANPHLDNRLSLEIQELIRRKTIQGADDAGGTRASAASATRRMRFAALRQARGLLKRSGMAVIRKLFSPSVTDSLETALFLRTGEVHRIGYDRFSLPRLLRQTGFDQVEVVGASQSSIPGFSDSGLDCIDGQPRKPGSLFVEGICPQRGSITQIPQRMRHEAAA